MPHVKVFFAPDERPLGTPRRSPGEPERLHQVGDSAASLPNPLTGASMPSPATSDLKTCATPQPALTARFEHRPEYLFGLLCPDVIDASTRLRERTVTDLKVIHIPDLFSSPQEVFLGFGTPNMYITFPRADDSGYDKFAGKSLYRAPSTIEDTRKFVQSGVLLHLINPPEELAQSIREAAAQHNGEKFRTCVNACCTVLHSAGVSIPGRNIQDFTFPVDLLQAVIKRGLLFNEQRLEYQIIKTSPKSVERYALGIVKAELATFSRHCKRAVDSQLKRMGIEPGAKRGSPGVATTRSPIAPPAPTGAADVSDILVSASRTASIGLPLRFLWGAHTLFETRQNRVSADEFLPERLQAFPQSNPSLLTRIKSSVLFSRPVVSAIRTCMCPSFEEVGLRSEADIYEMFRTHSEENPAKYNLVITGDAMTISRIKVGNPVVDWVLTKHVLVSGYNNDVRFAGEIWKDAAGLIHVSRNSGTYRPSANQLKQAEIYLRRTFPHLTVVAEDF